MKTEEIKTLVCPECGTELGQWLPANTAILRPVAGLTEQDIVDRADFYHRVGNLWLTLALLCALTLVALWLPVHTWLHRHIELPLGFLLGTLAQSVPWLRDRWRWLKWFSV